MVFTRLFLGTFDCVFALFTIVLYIAVPTLYPVIVFVSVVILAKGLLSLLWSASPEKFYPEQQMIIAPVFDIALGLLLISSGIYFINFLGIIATLKGVEILISNIQDKFRSKSF